MEVLFCLKSWQYTLPLSRSSRYGHRHNQRQSDTLEMPIASHFARCPLKTYRDNQKDQIRKSKYYTRFQSQPKRVKSSSYPPQSRPEMLYEYKDIHRTF